MIDNTNYDYEKERNEAYDAGKRALHSLNLAKNELDHAHNWGIVDIFGGGLLTNLIKHSKMNNATGYMEQAKRDLQTFSRELLDVSQSIDLNFNTSDFLSFADYFFDGFVADWLVQDRIDQARRQVNEAINRVSDILGII